MNRFGKSNPVPQQQNYDDSAQSFIPNNSGYVQPVPNSPGMGDGNSSPVKAARRSRRDLPLLPCTIRQVLEAMQQTPEDEDFFVDGQPVNQVSVVGQILSTQHHPTNDTYLLDDCTARIEVRVWVDHNNVDDFAHQRSMEIQDSMYVRVIGNIRAFETKRSLIGVDVVPILDFNQLTYHHLDVLYASLHNAKLNQDEQQQAQYVTQGNVGQQDAGLPPLQQELVSIIRDCPTPETGYHITQLTDYFNTYSEEDVQNAIAALIEDGHLYTTIDSFHFAVTDQ